MAWNVLWFSFVCSTMRWFKCRLGTYADIQVKKNWRRIFLSMSGLWTTCIVLLFCCCWCVSSLLTILHSLCELDAQCAKRAKFRQENWSPHTHTTNNTRPYQKPAIKCFHRWFGYFFYLPQEIILISNIFLHTFFRCRLWRMFIVLFMKIELFVEKNAFYFMRHFVHIVNISP